MDLTHQDPLRRAERHLHLTTRGHEHGTLARWGAHCPELTNAPIRRPAQLKAWLHTQPTGTANRILAGLVTGAQHGDHTALVAVIVCLAPGIRALAARTGLGLDEAISEVAVGILNYPVARRSSIAGGLLLDARNRIHRQRQRQPDTQPLDPANDTAHPTAPGDLGHQEPAAQHLVRLVCQAHRQGLLDHADAKLIIDTRLGGHRVRPVAEQLGLTPAAAYQRRTRAETRLTQLV